MRDLQDSKAAAPPGTTALTDRLAAHEFVECEDKVQLGVLFRRRRREGPRPAGTPDGVGRRGVVLRVAGALRHVDFFHFALQVDLDPDHADQVQARGGSEAPVGTHGKHDLAHVDVVEATAAGAVTFAAAPAPEAKSAPVTLDSKPATLTTPLKAQDAYGPKHAAYFRKLVMELRNATFIPAELAKGTYYATVRLEMDASGKILNYSILQSSGSELLDRYVRQGIRRAGKVSPPPAAVGRFVNVTLTLVR